MFLLRTIRERGREAKGKGEGETERVGELGGGKRGERKKERGERDREIRSLFYFRVPHYLPILLDFCICP